MWVIVLPCLVMAGIMFSNRSLDRFQKAYLGCLWLFWAIVFLIGPRHP